MNKRLLKELKNLIIQQQNKPLLENDYLVTFDEFNLAKVFAIIKGPYDSVYRHKFIRLDFDIPNNYPYQPPIVTFVNYDGVRINPTMYENGKCCSTILNTWPGENEAWSSSMGVETIILTFLSFLDNNPYMLEPGGRDDTSYTDYVLYQTWNTCLIKYIENTQYDLFSEYISDYLLANINTIINDLHNLNYKYTPDAYQTNCFHIGYYTINYTQIINKVIKLYNLLDYKEHFKYKISDIPSTNIDYSCNICFDTEISDEKITLSCRHKFHLKCIKSHIKMNTNVCSLCRTNINTKDIKEINESNTWVINPLTNRKIKVNGKTYNKLNIQHIIKK